MRRIYLDYAATTPAAPEVIAAMLPYFSELYGNASSLHEFGFEARRAVEAARKTAARFFGCVPEDVVFTGSGTESNNMALQGSLAMAAIRPAHIVTTVMEHSSVYNTCRYLERRGHDMTVLPVDADGRVDPDRVERVLREETVLISVQHANNEIGTVQPLEAIAEIADRRGILFHTDAVQAAGKLPIDMRAQKIDLLSASGHKFYGPKGAGLLCLNRAAIATKLGAKRSLFKASGDGILQPLMYGGPQESGLRPATENVAAIAGLGKAVELAAEALTGESARLERLRDAAIDSLLREVPGARLNGPRQGRLANNINICIPGANGYELMLLLDRSGIASSTGAACSSGSEKPSRVLSAIGLSQKDALCSLRLSLGKSTTEVELDMALGKIRELVCVVKGSSGV